MGDNVFGQLQIQKLGRAGKGGATDTQGLLLLESCRRISYSVGVKSMRNQ